MSRLRTIGAGVHIGWLVCITIVCLAAQLPVDQRPSDRGKCESCHSEISSSYRKTPMATASGPATEGVTPGEFSDKESDVRYRVFKRDEKVWMNYAREGKGALHGEKELEYYVGSGKKGRAYLFSQEGFWFRAPVSWNSQEGRWKMTPASLD